MTFGIKMTKIKKYEFDRNFVLIFLHSAVPKQKKTIQDTPDSYYFVNVFVMVTRFYSHPM